ncbi:MAG: META domain-containing protein [Cyanobacteria bacterium J06621_11]
MNTSLYIGSLVALAGSSMIQPAAISQASPICLSPGKSWTVEQQIQCTRDINVDSIHTNQLAQQPIASQAETLFFSQTADIALRVYTADGQPRLNLYNKANGITELQGVAMTVESTTAGVTYRYSGKQVVEVAIATSGEQNISLNNVTLDNYDTVTGTVFYLPRIVLPPNAVITVELVDVSRADTAAGILASKQIVAGGRQVPFPFELAYDPAQIAPGLSYAVQARITVDEDLRFINTASVPVITNGNPINVEVRLDSVNATETTDDTAMLTNTVWQLQQIRYNNGTVLEAIPPGNYTLQFMDDGQLSIRADCNQALGNFTQDGSRLSVTLGPITLAACGPDSIEQDYLQALQDITTYSLQDGNLSIQLRDNASTLMFSETPTAPTIIGTVWQLQQIQYNNDTVLTANPPENYTVEFIENGDIAVQADCNRGFGRFSSDNSQLSIDSISTTRVACLPSSIGNEFIQALQEAVSYFFQDDELFIDLKFDTGTIKLSAAEGPEP